MRNINFAKLKQRLKNGFVAALFIGAQAGAVAVPFLPAVKASAAVVSSSVASTGYVIKNTSSYSVVAGQPNAGGSFKNGNVGAYPEGACIPAVFQVTNTSGTTGDLFVTPVIDYLKSGTKDLGFTRLETVTSNLTDATTATNLNQLGFPGTELSGATSFKTTTGGAITASVSGPYSGNDTTTTGPSNSDTFRHYNVTLNSVPNGATVNVLTCGRLGLDASEYNGSSLSIRTVQGGQENVPIPVNEILVLPSITITKTVSSGSALPTDFSFTVSPSVNGQSVFPITSGNSVTINNVNPDGQYTITESGPANYKFTGGTGSACTVNAGTVGTANGQMVATVAAGKPASNATCNFTNTLQQGSITLVKNVINNNGGTANSNSFGLTIGGTSVTSGQTLQLNPGSYAVNEAGLAGYSFVSLTGAGCPSQLGGSVTLAGGQNITCTITNDDVAPQLTVIKHVINNNGGNKVASDFTMNITGTNVSNASFAGAESPGTTVTLNAGSYSVGETNLTGYAASYSTDCTGTIALGETKTCTITNDDIAPLLTVTKVVINNDGGTLQVSDFPLSVGNVSVTSGVQNSFSAGTYTVSELQVAGYTGVISGDCALNGSITLQVGGVYACTITNNDQPAKVTVNKIVVNDNGGTKTASDFTLKVNNTTVVNGVTNTFNANAAYTVSEVGLTGYTQTSLVCKDKNTNATLSNPFTPTVGQEVVCTITNDDVAPTLKLVKTVVNNDGGTATTANFQGKISGTNVAWDTAVAKTAGSYTASESVLAGGEGYSASTWGGDCAANGSVTLSVGDVKTCTITNDDIAPQLTVVKHVVNNNVGTKAASDFMMNVTGTNVSDNSFPGNEAGTTVSLNAGAFSVGEDSVTGYTPSLSGDCSGTVHVGDTKTCTITNTAQPGSISGYKCEVNASATDCDGNGLEGWTIYADLNGNNAFDFGEPSDVTDANGAYSIGNLAPGTYALREVNQTDWTQIFPGSPNDELSVTLGQGQNSTGNNFGNFHNATISGTKWNDANGNRQFDENESTLANWTIFIDANSNQKLDSGELSTTTDNNGNYSFNSLAPGTYTVCEQQQVGWVQMYPTDNNGCHIVTVEESNHNYTKNDFGNQGQGKITIIKDAQPNSDQAFTFTGNLTGDDESNFTLTDNGTNDGTDRRVFSSMPQGTYTVTEPSVKGWKLLSVECTGGSDTATHERNAVINLNAGEDVTCVFTNGKSPTLTVVKDAQPNDAQDFNFSITKQNIELDNLRAELVPLLGFSKTFALDDDNDPTLSNTEVTQDLDPGAYVVHEDATAGWTLDNVDCGEGVEFAQEGTDIIVYLPFGADVTCTFTNVRDTGTVTIDKKVTPSTDHGKFNLQINGVTYAANVGDGGTTGAVVIPTGDFTASETAGTNTSLGDYEASYNCISVGGGSVASGSGSNIALTLSKNQNIVCTFTNNKGEILGATAPLVNTGSNILVTSLASLAFITAVAGLSIATRRRTTTL